MPPMPTRFRWTVVAGILISIYLAINMMVPIADSLPWGVKVVVTFLLSNLIFAMGRYFLWRLGLVKPDDEE